MSAFVEENDGYDVCESIWSNETTMVMLAEGFVEVVWIFRGLGLKTKWGFLAGNSSDEEMDLVSKRLSFFSVSLFPFFSFYFSLFFLF